MKNSTSFRTKFALIHLGISLIVAALVALLVFGFWYPYPYGNLTGGLHLFLLIIGVDLVCGPLCTLILANSKKSRRELALDLSLVALVQIAALGYGLYSVQLARPAVLAFEADRMVVVTAAEIDTDDLPNAPEKFQHLPWFGMQKVSIRKAKNEQEFFESVNLSLEGVEPSIRPSWWQPFDAGISQIKEKMTALATAKFDKLDAAKLTKLEKAVAETGLPKEKLFFLPLTSKYRKDWLVLLDENAVFVGFAPVSGFDLMK